MAQVIVAGKASIEQPAWFNLLRVALGIALIWKGITFIRDTSELKSLIGQTEVGIFTQNSEVLTLVITILTLLCGFLISVGLFTRLACIVQIPIVLVAALFVHLKDIDRNALELIFTFVVLLLLILFIIKGSGALSADEYFRWGAAVDKDFPNRRA